MGLFKKFFGKKDNTDVSECLDLIEETLMGIFDRADFHFSYDLQQKEDNIFVELYGKDEDLLKSRGGQLLDALQFLTKRVLQHHLPDQRIYIQFDSKGFREKSDQELLDLADQLKSTAIKTKRSMFCKALPPKQRRRVHQHLSRDSRVRTKSIGDGHYKKIKIIPMNERGFRGERPSYQGRGYR